MHTLSIEQTFLKKIKEWKNTGNKQELLTEYQEEEMIKRRTNFHTKHAKKLM